jgi:hypothetical protein
MNAKSWLQFCNYATHCEPAGSKRSLDSGVTCRHNCRILALNHSIQRSQRLAGYVGSTFCKHIPPSAMKPIKLVQHSHGHLPPTIVTSHYMSIPVYLQCLFINYLTTQCRHLVPCSVEESTITV